MNKNTSKLKQIAIILLFIITIAIGGYFNNEEENQTGNIVENNKISYDISNIPEYSGEVINIDGAHYSNLENGRVRKGNDKN